mgnify:FL=1
MAKDKGFFGTLINPSKISHKRDSKEEIMKTGPITGEGNSKQIIKEGSKAKDENTTWVKREADNKNKNEQNQKISEKSSYSKNLEERKEARTKELENKDLNSIEKTRDKSKVFDKNPAKDR